MREREEAQGLVSIDEEAAAAGRTAAAGRRRAEPEVAHARRHAPRQSRHGPPSVAAPSAAVSCTVVAVAAATRIFPTGIGDGIADGIATIVTIANIAAIVVGTGVLIAK